MQFELYLHKSEGFLEIVVRDTSKQLHQSGAMMLRSQSIYEKDGGKLVWKKASYPTAVWHSVQSNNGFKIAEAETIAMFDANIDYKILNHLWEVKQWNKS